MSKSVSDQSHDYPGRLENDEKNEFEWLLQNVFITLTSAFRFLIVVVGGGKQCGGELFDEQESHFGENLSAK